MGGERVGLRWRGLTRNGLSKRRVKKVLEDSEG